MRWEEAYLQALFYAHLRRRGPRVPDFRIDHDEVEAEKKFNGERTTGHGWVGGAHGRSVRDGMLLDAFVSIVAAARVKITSRYKKFSEILCKT